MSVLSNPEDAEEAAQEALLRSWRSLHTCRSDDVGPWTRQISRNEAMRVAARRARPELLAGELPEVSTVDEELEQLADAESVRGALREMSAADQLLIRLRYTEDLTQPQLAEILDIPEGTVKIRLHRARAKLRAALA
jgi:RNA polymerase sigma-70 factor, ECF subfamily